jgi:hypothetical protein
LTENIAEKSKLVGKKEIEDYVGRSFHKTIKPWIENRNFPARKIDGVWYSDKILIQEWFRNAIINGHQETEKLKVVSGPSE